MENLQENFIYVLNIFIIGWEKGWIRSNFDFVVVKLIVYKKFIYGYYF